MAVLDCLESVFLYSVRENIWQQQQRGIAQYWVTSDGLKRGQEQVGAGVGPLGRDLGYVLIYIFRNTHTTHCTAHCQTMLMCCVLDHIIRLGPGTNTWV